MNTELDGLIAMVKKNKKRSVKELIEEAFGEVAWSAVKEEWDGMNTRQRRRLVTKLEKEREVKEETKMDKARRLMETNEGVGRKEMLEMFMGQAGLTKAGAATYYALLKKK